MKLLKNSNTKIKSFWIKNYTDEDKEFFIGLGFTERRVKFMGEWMDGTLSFHGSRSFGWWSDEEYKNISAAVRKQYGKCSPRILSLAERM